MAFLPGLQKTGQGCVGAIVVLKFYFNLLKKRKESVF